MKSSTTSVIFLLSLSLLSIGCSSETEGSEEGVTPTRGGSSSFEADMASSPLPSDTSTTPSDVGPGQVSDDVEPEGPEACPSGTHRGDNGLCNENVCLADSSTCSDSETVKVCNVDGSAFDEYGCPPDQTCYLGACWAPICEPGEQAPVCDGGKVLKCNSLGIEWVAYPCPAGEACSGGECKPVPANVLFLVDTSGSMNWLPDGTYAQDCFGADCPNWTMPNCDDGPIPRTRLGKVKEALRAVLESDAISGMRLALQRFAQKPLTELYDFFFGDLLIGADCAGGYWLPAGAEEIGLMTGDTNPNQHLAPAFGWFGQNLDEILPVAFPEAGETEVNDLLQWMDDIESVSAGGQSCFDASQCNGGPCLHDGGSAGNNVCAQHINPELRAIGGTPLGKSLFYAGEYLRNFVFVEGKACVIDSDCGSSNHTCVNGACHDPFAECRPTVIIAFTDGEETENVHVDDFFHPRVQAKRLHYGLGCQTDDDCLSGATCDGIRCVPPADAVDESAQVCETGGTPCTSTSDCPDPCANWTGCQGYCTPAQVNVTDGNGADHLFSHDGTKRRVVVNIVDASGVVGANEYVSAYGGGKHFSVDLTDPETLIATVNEIIGDTKSAGPCGGP